MFVQRFGLVSASICRSNATLAPLLATKNWTSLLEAIDQAAPIDPSFFTQALWALTAHNQVTLAHKLLASASAHQISPGESHYTAVIECALRAGKRTLAANLYYQSQVFGIPLDAAVYNELIRALVKSGANQAAVMSLFSEMRKAELQPTALTCCSLLKLAIKSKDWPSAAKMLRMMHQWKMELPKNLVEESLVETVETHEYEEFRRVWAQIADSHEDESPSHPEGISPDQPAKDPLRLPKDALKLPLSFQLIVLPQTPESDDSENSGDEK